MDPEIVSCRKVNFIIISIVSVFSVIVSILLNLAHKSGYDHAGGMDIVLYIVFLIPGAITYTSVIGLPFESYDSKCYKKYIYLDESETTPILQREFTLLQKIFKLINCYRAVEIEKYPRLLYLYLYLLPWNVTNSIFALINNNILSYYSISMLVIFPGSILISLALFGIYEISIRLCSRNVDNQS